MPRGANQKFKFSYLMRIIIAEYSKATFGMYQGKRTRVTIEFEDYMCGVFIDRFGKDISFRKVADRRSELNVDINVSPQFFGWLFSLGDDVKVTGPEEVVEQIRDVAQKLIKKYE